MKDKQRDGGDWVFKKLIANGEEFYAKYEVNNEKEI